MVQWIEAAKNGSEEALGQVLEWCRPYLLRVADEELATDLQGKLGASDLVQETFLEAHRDFRQFRGRTDQELRGWLRAILRHNLGTVGRHYRETDKREVRREQALSEGSQEGLCTRLIDPNGTPSALVHAQEQDEALQRAMARLPETYRQVVEWRNYDRCSFEEIGRRLERSSEAARKLWVRAIEQLTGLLERPDESVE
jgi:RNA polymerase sigma-70 factor (ECF subfamily)